jgi:hypothetical protein
MLGSMTETREISRDVYVAIAAALHTAFMLIDGAMNDICHQPARLTAEWHELHGMMQLAHVAQEMAERGRDQAPDPDAPIPYLPAPCEHDGPVCTCLADTCLPADPIPPGILALEGLYEIRDRDGSSVLAEGPWLTLDSPTEPDS